MHNNIIVDTSCLIILEKIGQLELLEKVYNKVIVTNEIASEFGSLLPEWIVVKNVNDKKYQELLELQIDKGEASAIALAKEIDNPLILIDDLKARRLAQKLNIKYSGVLGLINKAKQMNVIDKVKPVIQSLLSNNFWISEKIINELLIINNEL